MEKAFHELGRDRLAHVRHRHGPEWKLVRTYGLRRDLLAMSQAWDRGDGTDHFIVATKGAPEAIAGLCRLGNADMAALTQSVDAMAVEGMRVLGVAHANFKGQTWPNSQRDFQFDLVGLVGLADPLRTSVRDAMSECRLLGLKWS